VPRSTHRAVPEERGLARAWRRALLSALLATMTAAPVLSQAPSQAPSPPPARSVLDLQPAMRVTQAAIANAAGRRGTATLAEPNPQVHAWLVLTLQWQAGGPALTYHLQNADPRGQRIALSASDPQRVRIARPDPSDPSRPLAGDADCDLWHGAPSSALDAALASIQAWAPLCGGRLLLRNRVAGRASTLERATDFLRDHVWGGERLVGFVRREFFADAFVEHAGRAGEPSADARRAGGPNAPDPAGTGVPAPVAPDAPAPLRTEPAASAAPIEPGTLGIALDGQDANARVLPGRWYGARGLPGVFVSAIQPGQVAAELLRGDAGRVQPLDGVESGALALLLAFDLARFELGFAIGTDHPRAGWADRVPADMKPAGWPGPDGFDSFAPLVPNGMLDPPSVARAVATFTGGFKRQHGAMHEGELAHRRHASHYGFVEQGTVLSRLQPGLSTLLVRDDGSVDLKTWTEADDARLAHVRHARQNGVPLIERRAGDADAALRPGVPGALVNRWAAGNWSGSVDASLRTLRAGACLLPSAGRRYLVYGYFSSATPSAMVRVFQASGCSDAMLLDMNALEHTYAAVYPRAGAQVAVEHLVRGMSVIDRDTPRGLVPRFLGMPDDRDFFYVLRREAP
jgi:hypothetical protein